MSKTTAKRNLVVPSARENKLIEAAAKRDPDAPPLSSKQLKAMVPMKALRGRPRLASKKLLVSIRYSAEVLEYFRASGEGWQARMDGVLMEYVSKKKTVRRRIEK